MLGKGEVGSMGLKVATLLLVAELFFARQGGVSEEFGIKVAIFSLVAEIFIFLTKIVAKRILDTVFYRVPWAHFLI